MHPTAQLPTYVEDRKQVMRANYERIMLTCIMSVMIMVKKIVLPACVL